ncbi:3-deoxy-7-phosphoheptulonate synthase class II [Saccharothrix violaceirubra]|uniref:Phospho-2-dehydro-3-deoxyheptonate aldolase n=1 Tax=Saccharothrix violaceirubra TaxID=413306 RepID=A0A7W7T2Y8_9PSEU|nr:3-deoxy-7-phosphoheptulonate synthase [Saccharothrix violaceirubra]MBB4965589.1 3-deoxy-7-phosphoheptulonate synthase [Saccharothrix violaceirubra]
MGVLRESLAVEAAQQPQWSTRERLDAVVDELRRRPPLVDAESCHALAAELEFVARGESFVVQVGECAELFADSSRARIQAKAAQVHGLCEIVEAVGLPTVRIGRFAGQYGKPRSSDTETLPDGTALPVYRGDAVNDLAPTASARRADPLRLLAAYDHAASGLNALFMRQLLLPGNSGLSAMLAPTYISHEALLLDFERALVRPDPVRGGEYASSAHMVWIGERTRQLDHAHLAFAAAIGNPVGVKIGPTARPEDVVAIVDRLAAGRRPGRLCLIVRMGVDAIADRLPHLVTALGESARDVVWLSDPMHGNTVRTNAGRKTRVVSDVLREVERFCAVLRRHGCHPGGVHLEATPDPVSECLATRADLASGAEPDRFESACDPRLNGEQAEQVVRHVAELLCDG